MPYTVIDNVAYGSSKLQIIEVFQKLPQLFADHHVVLTYMDSGLLVDRANLELGIDYQLGRRLGLACLLNNLHLEQVMQNLSGFDEVFVLKAEAIQDFPDVDSFCTPGYFSESVPQEFIDTFKAVGASLYLGDGIGLNYACDPQYAPLIEELPDLETYHLRVLPLKLDRSGPFDPQVIGPVDIRKRTISL